MSDKLLRASEAAKYLAISKSTFWRWVAAKKLPKGIHFSPKCTVWRTVDLDAFVQSKADENHTNYAMQN